jgi:hypothetical protein
MKSLKRSLAILASAILEVQQDGPLCPHTIEELEKIIEHSQQTRSNSVQGEAGKSDTERKLGFKPKGALYVATALEGTHGSEIRTDELTASADILEQLADLEHRQWQHWTAYFLSNLTKENEVRWSEQALKNYSQLSEEDKEKDRVWARKVLALIKGEQTEQKFTCQKCKHEVKFGVKYCGQCGMLQLWGLFG